MNNILPEIRIQKLRNACDRYGFSGVIAKKTGITFAPLSFANWLHGWIWNDPYIEIFVGGRGQRKSLSIVVASEHEKQVVDSKGYTNCVLGGLPLIYVPEQGIARRDKTLLAFLPHSTESAKLKKSHLDYLDYLHSVRRDFSDVYVSIYWYDNSPDLQDDIKKRDLIPVIGARPDDMNALARMRRMLEFADYVTSNCIGSHIAYALYCGCTVSICGPYHMYDNNMITAAGNVHEYSESYYNHLIESQKESYVKGRYPWLFPGHPAKGRKDVSYGEQILGKKWMLGDKDLKKVLGWTVEGQIKGYVTGGLRRVNRYVRSV
ncbi:hypothetical protein CferDRAFT_1822 [Chlorobium ferrooxidans DSM 13031]|uniref:Uncharacterized protein n=1 Tax=Chlorobium ferrooxidans DSM 13031 TaxID=377431 RepID=Q0YTT6_9CHLB|nr:hypothetical protein CferDRAFT_1822 [Chlorobium ferrooxidans DSM 13031]